MSDKRRLQELHADISGHLDGIARLFTNPKEVKITVVVRQPWLDDGDVVLSDDETEMVIAALRRLAEREPTVAGSNR